LASDEAVQIRAELERMVSDPTYTTRTFYTPSDAHLSFADKHMSYLSEHPKLKASEYLANLRLMTKNRV
jgi:hypothetical protein